MRALLIASIAAVAAFALGGCATSTRVMQMGPLVNGEPLVTLVVSEDRMVVRRECFSVPSVGPALGCHLWHRVTLPDTGPVQLVRIIRYTDSMPSALALEIDAHELCHAIAALQPIQDPCHVGNGGVVESASAHLRRE